MTRAALVLRPQPGASDTAARLTALGMPVRCCPLFVVSPVAWSLSDVRAYDALLLTSANAVRHAGPGLTALASLPVLAVGEATAEGARTAGLKVALTGCGGAAELVGTARARDYARPLHLAGRDRIALPNVDQVTVYASEPTALDAATVRDWAGLVGLLHSPRSARRFAELCDEYEVDRARIDVVALSAAVAKAAGSGWASCLAVASPDDALMAAAAQQLIDPPAPRADKRQQ